METTKPAATLLLVDDEQGILNALRRLLRPDGYQIFTAESGEAGLAILEQEHIDLVISDMRMPHMDGAVFLGHVKRRWPDTMRILLTGYSEISATISAINQGEIYRYIAKPWDDNEISLAIRQALQQAVMRDENRRLLALTEKQNKDLKQLNEGLEALVEQRTGELQQTVMFLELAQKDLKKSFLHIVNVFSSMMEFRNGKISGHARRVADLARRLAQRMKLGEQETQDVLYAALLHDIGKIALSDSLLNRPFYTLSMSDQAEVMKHPIKGEMALMGIDPLKSSSVLIRAHHERYDGNGYPDNLSGNAIPLGARIIAVVNDYDALHHGMLQNKRYTDSELKSWMIDGKGSRYDPEIVDRFLEMIGESKLIEEPETMVYSHQLHPGMILSRDLNSAENYLLLARGHNLTTGLIQQIRQFEQSERITLQLHVRTSSIRKQP